MRDISTAQSAVQLKERDTLLNKLNEEEIACLPLKDCLLKEMYPKAEYREMADLDILVHYDDYEKIDRIMAEAGYRKKERNELSVHNNYEKAPFMDIEMHDSLFNELYFEQHELNDSVLSFVKDPWSCAVHEEKSSVYHLSWEDFYIYLILHLAKHFDASGTGIRQFLDIWVFLESHEIDHEYVYAKLSGRLSEFCRNAEALVSAWIDDAPMNEELEQMESYIFGSGVFGNMQNRIANRLSEMEETKSKEMTAVSYVFKRTFPSAKMLKKNYPVLKKYPVLLPGVWVLRLITKLSGHNSKGRREVRAFMNYFKKKEKDD